MKQTGLMAVCVGACVSFGACANDVAPEVGVADAADLATAEVLSTANHRAALSGLTVENCKVETGEDFQAYVRWDRNNFYLVGGFTPSLDLSAPDGSGPSAPLVYEYAEDTRCRGTAPMRCQSTERVYVVGVPGFSELPLPWTYRTFDERMGIFTSVDPGTGSRLTCSNFKLVGAPCLAAMQRLRTFAQQNNIQLTRIDLSDAVCQ